MSIARFGLARDFSRFCTDASLGPPPVSPVPKYRNSICRPSATRVGSFSHGWPPPPPRAALVEVGVISSLRLVPYPPGLSAATISLPSTPFHRPIGNGIGRPHVSFCVENAFRPECAAIDGSENGNPKQSGK